MCSFLNAQPATNIWLRKDCGFFSFLWFGQSLSHAMRGGGVPYLYYDSFFNGATSLLGPPLLNQISIFDVGEPWLGEQMSPRGCNGQVIGNCSARGKFFGSGRWDHFLTGGFHWASVWFQTDPLLLQPLGAVTKSCLGVFLAISLPRHSVAGLSVVLLYVQHVQLLAGEMGADLIEVGHDDQPIGHRRHDHVWRFHQSGDSQFCKSIKCLEQQWGLS